MSSTTTSRLSAQANTRHEANRMAIETTIFIFVDFSQCLNYGVYEVLAIVAFQIELLVIRLLQFLPEQRHREVRWLHIAESVQIQNVTFVDTSIVNPRVVTHIAIDGNTWKKAANLRIRRCPFRHQIEAIYHAIRKSQQDVGVFEWQAEGHQVFDQVEY